MPRMTFPTRFATVLLAASLLALTACATGGGSPVGTPPSAQGTHTVIGRGFFTGGVMVLVDAHLEDGRAWGSVEYSRVHEGAGGALRVMSEVTCVGIFRNGTEAVITGPVDQVYGDPNGVIDRRDFWVLEIRDQGADGDLLRASSQNRQRALDLCQTGPETVPTLRSVDGDLSIH